MAGWRLIQYPPNIFVSMLVCALGFFRYQRLAKPTGLELESMEGKEEEDDDVVVYEKD